MAFRAPSRKNSSSLSIKPPSPSAIAPPTISTPTSYFNHSASDIASPRKAPIPPSPTGSIAPQGTAPWLEDRHRSNSLDVPRLAYDVGPPVPSKGAGGHKQLPLPPGSPHRRGVAQVGGYAGAYDNKLVSSTLSHLPPLPPLSPQPTGPSMAPQTLHPRPGPPTQLTSNPYTNLLSSTAPRPAFSAPSSSSGVVVLPNGTALSTSNAEHDRVNIPDPSIGVGRSLTETLAHSSPSSPWSLLTVHALPLFAGGPLKTPIEDLNQLCHSHIIATSQRAQPARIVAVLSSDFREFVASGMLTLKAKFATLEESKVVARAAEVWSFFWAQVLPYLEGVFLPLAQVQDLPSTSRSSSSSSSPPIAVKHLLLSGFLCHLLLPLLPRLSPLISAPTPANMVPPSSSDLQRILQMSLVLSTQARYSSFFPTNESVDEEVRLNVDSLGKVIRWRISRPLDVEVADQSHLKRVDTSEGGNNWIGNRKSLQRGPSMNNGRFRRRGWRASTNFGQTWGQPPPPEYNPGMNRQYSDILGGVPENKWGRPRVEEEDDEDITPGQSLAYPRNTVNEYGGPGGQSMYASTANSTLTAGSTVRGADSLASNIVHDYQRTPQADFGRRVRRTESSGSSEMTPVAQEARRR